MLCCAYIPQNLHQCELCLIGQAELWAHVLPNTFPHLVAQQTEQKLFTVMVIALGRFPLLVLPCSYFFFHSDIISSTWLTFTKQHGEICFSIQLMLWSFKPYKTVSLYDLSKLLWQTLLESHIIGMTRKSERGKLQIQYRIKS